MKNNLLLLLLVWFTFTFTSKAQTTLTENFDNGIPDDWAIIDANNDGKTLHSPSKYSIYGQTKVACFSKCSDDYLITPRMTVSDANHMFSFDASGNNEYAAFSMDVMISETAPEIANFVSVQNLEGIKVPVGWVNAHHDIDLTAYIGKDVYVAFHIYFISSVYSDFGIENVVGPDRWVDSEARIKIQNIEFPLGNVGSTVTSNLTVQNKGAKDMVLTNVELTGSFTCDFSGLTIKAGEEAFVELGFAPQTAGKFTGTITFTGEGIINGENSIELTAVACSESSLFEGFEGEKFPPVAWSVAKDDLSDTKNTWTQLSSNAFAGVKSSGLMYGQIAGRLVTPKLKINAGDKMYFNLKFRTVTEVKVQFSEDGVRWTDLITITDNNSELYKEYELDLTSAAGENYIAFYADKPYCFLDNVSLPGFAVAPIPPTATFNPVPADKAEKIYVTPELKWEKVEGATGYKIFMGTNLEANNLVDGLDLGDVNTYNPSKLNYNTVYNWKIIPYNVYGEVSDAAVWSFTTFKELILKENDGLPYFQGFEDAEFAPLGWAANDTIWKHLKGFAHEGDFAAWVYGNKTKESILYGPQIIVPANYQLEYFWAMNYKGEIVKDTKSSGENITYFEISKDNGAIWETLDTLDSDYLTKFDSVYHNLSDMAGEIIAIRWRHMPTDGLSSLPTLIDDVQITPIPANPEISVSTNKWYAGYVNEGESMSSQTVEIINGAGGLLKFTYEGIHGTDFSVNLEEKEYVLGPREKQNFIITYTASNQGEDHETLVLKTNDVDLEISLDGYTLKPEGMKGDFENVKDFSLDLAPWTTVDVDKSGTYGFGSSVFPHYGEPMSFMALNPSQCTPALEGVVPHSGSKFGACFSAEMPEYGGTGPNNDWLISPKTTVEEDMYIEFFAQTWGGWAVNEQINVLVSTSDNEIESFTCISGEVPVNVPIGEWTGYMYDLSEYAGQDIHVAIQCVTAWGVAFLIDDIAFKVKENAIPEFLTSAITEAEKDVKYSYNIKVNDTDASDILTIDAKDDLPEWLTITQTNNYEAELSGTPDEIKDYQIILTVSDGELTAEQAFTIHVDGNTKPEFISTPVTVASVGVVYSYTIMVDDIDTDDDLTIKTKEELPSWLSLGDMINNEAVLSGTPEQDEEVQITLVLSDGELSAEQTFAIVVTGETTGITDGFADNQLIYPNPAKGEFSITNCNNAAVSIYNILGIVIDSFKITSDNYIVDAGDWKSGLYIVKIELNNEISSSRIKIL